MKTAGAVKSTSSRVAAASLALAGVQLLLAIAALYLDLSEACGGCRVGGELRPWIAGAGVLGYAALLVLGAIGRREAFYQGSFVALGVHVALGTAMAVAGSICWICAAAALVGLALGALALRARPAAAPYATAGAAVLTLLVALPGAIAAQERSVHRERVTKASNSSLGPTVLEVFEAERCSYCQDFRKHYLPRLRADFGASVEVRFQDAKSARWVERTPTFLLDGVPVFEGLPNRYEDLREVLDVSRRGR